MLGLSTRVLVLATSLLLTYAAARLFLSANSADGASAFDWFRTMLIALVSFWLTFSAGSALLGLSYREVPSRSFPRARGLTAVLVPIYNEDPAATFSRVAAMNQSLAAIDAEKLFHFVILSDTNRMDVAAEEAIWLGRLLADFDFGERLFYRRRQMNAGKKAGNIEDFITRAGGAYDYAVILDADSLLEGAALVEMAARMEASPRLGLLQTVPSIIHARSVFGRMAQFCSAYFAPAFTRGAAMMQGGEGPFWGHNAIVRVRAFASSCGLPRLEGKAPFGGDILSHDYVEAALLARNGWEVRVDPDIKGSFEEGPENLIEFAKRDRRWCQGNLQHIRLISTPGLRFWNRFTFFQGIMSYLVSPLLFLFLLTSIVAGLWPETLVPMSRLRIAELSASTLLLGVIILLVVPRLLIVVLGMNARNRSFGNTVSAGFSVLAEISISTVMSPILLLMQTRAVLQVLMGKDSGWPPTRRNESQLSLGEAWAASSFVFWTGLTLLVIALLTNREVALWMTPVTLPMLFAPLIIKWTSHGAAEQSPLFATPEELSPSPVLLERQRILARWMKTGHPAGFTAEPEVTPAAATA